MPDRDVAVIMSTYAEKPEWLEASIESILNQTYDRFMFYIALDNPDNQELNELVRCYARQDPRVVVVDNERNIGLVETLNRLIDQSNSSYIARMDADDIARPERLERELGYLEANDLDLVMCGADIISGNEIVPGRALPEIAPAEMAEIQKHTNISFHSSWLGKRELYQALNGYRNINRCEDYDFVLRAIQAGYRVSRMSEMLMIYRLADNGISNENWMEQELNARYLRERYSSGEDVALIAPADINGRACAFAQRDRNRYASAKSSYDDLFTAVEGRRPLRAVGVALKGAMNPVFRKKMRDVLDERRAVSRICKSAQG